MRIIGADEIDRALTYPALVDALSAAFCADITVPVRHHHTIAARERSWRARVPSPKLTAFAQRLGLNVSPHARAGEVSNMVTLALATRRIDGHLPTYLKGRS